MYVVNSDHGILQYTTIENVIKYLKVVIRHEYLMDELSVTRIRQISYQ